MCAACRERGPRGFPVAAASFGAAYSEELLRTLLRCFARDLSEAEPRDHGALLEQVPVAAATCSIRRFRGSARAAPRLVRWMRATPCPLGNRIALRSGDERAARFASARSRGRPLAARCAGNRISAIGGNARRVARPRWLQILSGVLRIVSPGCRKMPVRIGCTAGSPSVVESVARDRDSAGAVRNPGILRCAGRVVPGVR